MLNPFDRVGVVDESQGVVVSWNVEEVTEELDQPDQGLLFPTQK